MGLEICFQILASNNNTVIRYAGTYVKCLDDLKEELKRVMVIPDPCSVISL